MTRSAGQECLSAPAAALSADSEHPLARPLRQLVPLPRIAVERLENVPGAGIRARIDGDEWRLGNPDFAGQAAVGHQALAPRVEQARRQGQTVSLLCGPGGVEAVLVFEHPLRPRVERMLHGLRESGIARLAILSGDAISAVTRLGERLGIADCHGGMSPQDKLAWTHDRQRQGHKVTMFGDGINDAPTLAAADAPVSFSSATDLASTSRDFPIPGNGINVLVRVRRLAGQTRRIIRQNLVWAAGCNLVAVPFAALRLQRGYWRCQCRSDMSKPSTRKKAVGYPPGSDF